MMVLSLYSGVNEGTLSPLCPPRYRGKQRTTMIPVSVFYAFFYVPYFLPRQCFRVTSSFILPRIRT